MLLKVGHQGLNRHVIVGRGRSAKSSRMGLVSLCSPALGSVSTTVRELAPDTPCKWSSVLLVEGIGAAPTVSVMAPGHHRRLFPVLWPGSLVWYARGWSDVWDALQATPWKAPSSILPCLRCFQLRIGAWACGPGALSLSSNQTIRPVCHLVVIELTFEDPCFIYLDAPSLSRLD